MLISLQGSGPLTRRVYGGLRRAILDGALIPGERLPSTRSLSKELAVSRTTVLSAFDQLIAEGYVEGRRGSGTYVASELPEVAFRARRPELVVAPSPKAYHLSAYGQRLAEMDGLEPRSLPGRRFDFSYGAPPIDSQSHQAWLRLSNRVLQTAPHQAFQYAEPTGDERLRVAIADYLVRNRALRCEPDQILIVNGTQQTIDLVTRVLLDPGDQVLMEEPYYLGARRAFAASGARVVTLPVDETGIDPHQFPVGSPGMRLAYITPSHQFPTGATMSVSRRLALLEWAEREDALVLEDDYDSEYRFEGRPVESLQGLDRSGRVIYAGTFSKVLYPGLRLGYVVLPEGLLDAFIKAKSLCDRHSPTLIQRTLTAFLNEGHFERHLRRERTRFASRRAALLSALEREFGDSVRIQGENAGIHLVAWLAESPPGGLEAGVERAKAAGIGLQSVSHCYSGIPPGDGLLLGFVSMGEERIAEGVAELKRALYPS